MISSSLLHQPSILSYHPWKQKIGRAWQQSVRILNKHTDIISSGGILILTTCLLAAKIFSKIPPILPRLSLVILNFGGIIWLNVQVRDFIKTSRDFWTAIKIGEFSGCVMTSAKVLVRGIDTLLTCGLFTASVVAFCGFPETTLLMYLAMRPFAIVSLSLGIATEIANYFINESLLDKLREIDPDSQRIKKVMHCFVTRTLAYAQWKEEGIGTVHQEDNVLAMRIIRQLDTQTLETFQERLSEKISFEVKTDKMIRIFYAMKESLQNKQAATKANLFLIALGYISMGICKIFPGSLVEISLRWGMSVLYTDELIKQKFFQSELANQISH